MAPAYRDESFLIIQPGSLNTLFKLGVEDSTTPPAYSIPTRVYPHPTTPNFYAMKPTNDSCKPIYPIKGGKIENVGALNFLFKSIINSLLKSKEFISLNSLSLTLIQTSNNWSDVAIERITNYLFEVLSLQAITIVSSSLSAMFSYGSYANSCVIDIGYEKTEISPIVDFQVYNPSVKVLNKGGHHINKTLKKLLPSLNLDQIELLKKSDNFECLSEEDAKGSFFGVDGLVEKKTNDGNGDEDDEGILDIAAIVTSDKSTRQILEEKEKKNKKSKGNIKSNSELENNTFIDDNGTILNIGKERFQGCNDLIDSIVFEVYNSLNKIQDLKKRQECYDNIIICGQTSKIKGFKENLLFKLYNKYVITINDKLNQQQQALSQFRNDITPTDDTSIVQVPKHMRLLSKPDYFTEWKKLGFEDCSFLGGEILAKQIFGNSNNELLLTKDDYQEKGPMGIWNVKL